MASTKFLEEALSMDVDESAVNAIVGSLESQFVMSAPTVAGHQASSASVSQQNHQVNSAISNGGTITAVQPQEHGVSNGGGATTVNSLMTQEVTKSITTSTLKPVNVVTPNTVTPQVITQQPQPQSQPQQQQQHAQPPGISSATYINQETTNQVSSNQTTHIPSLTKTHKPVKFIYPTIRFGQVIPTTGVANANNKLSFPAQTVGQLTNGTLDITSQAVLQTTANVVTNDSSVSQAASQTVIAVNKPTGVAFMIKRFNVAPGMVSVPMSVPVSVAGNAVSTALQAKDEITSTIVPSNVQILNENTMRPATPVAGQQANEQVTPRAVIGQHQLVRARTGSPGALHNPQAGAQRGGYLLSKTENGQYQLLRVGPAPSANSITGNAVVAAPSPGTTHRLTSVPTVSRLKTQFTGPSLATIRRYTPRRSVQHQTTYNPKEKCRKFLANLLELSSREPKAVEHNVRTLIQELIDTKVEPEEFCDRLRILLNCSPQPCLIGLLNISLPLLRQSLVMKELVIEGIKSPPANVVFSIASAVIPTITQ